MCGECLTTSEGITEGVPRLAVGRITGVTEGGDCVLPLLPLAFGLGSALNGVYNVGKAVDSYRYWNDYYRNTGYRPRYPFRSGVYDYLSYGGRVVNGFAKYYDYW